MSIATKSAILAANVVDGTINLVQATGVATTVAYTEFTTTYAQQRAINAAKRNARPAPTFAAA